MCARWIYLKVVTVAKNKLRKIRHVFGGEWNDVCKNIKPEYAIRVLLKPVVCAAYTLEMMARNGPVTFRGIGPTLRVHLFPFGEGEEAINGGRGKLA